MYWTMIGIAALIVLIVLLALRDSGKRPTQKAVSAKKQLEPSGEDQISDQPASVEADEDPDHDECRCSAPGGACTWK